MTLPHVVPSLYLLLSFCGAFWRTLVTKPFREHRLDRKPSSFHWTASVSERASCHIDFPAVWREGQDHVGCFLKDQSHSKPLHHNSVDNGYMRHSSFTWLISWIAASLNKLQTSQRSWVIERCIDRSEVWVDGLHPNSSCRTDRMLHKPATLFGPIWHVSVCSAGVSLTSPFTHLQPTSA